MHTRTMKTQEAKLAMLRGFAEKGLRESAAGSRRSQALAEILMMCRPENRAPLSQTLAFVRQNQ